MFLLLSACSQKSTLKIINTKAQIITHHDQTDTSHTLQYTVNVKNTSWNKKMTWSLIKFKVDPNKKLVSLSNKVIGENIFKDPSQWGHEIKCKDNYHCIFTLNRSLPETDKNQDLSLLDKNTLLNADLVVTEDNKKTRIPLK